MKRHVRTLSPATCGQIRRYPVTTSYRDPQYGGRKWSIRPSRLGEVLISRAPRRSLELDQLIARKSRTKCRTGR